MNQLKLLEQSLNSFGFEDDVEVEIISKQNVLKLCFILFFLSVLAACLRLSPLVWQPHGVRTQPHAGSPERATDLLRFLSEMRISLQLSIKLRVLEWSLRITGNLCWSWRPC